MSLCLIFLICIHEENGFIPSSYAGFKQGDTLMDGHYRVPRLGVPPDFSDGFASSCPSCPEIPRLRGRETCPRSHTEKEVELRHHPVLSIPGLQFHLQATWPAGEISEWLGDQGMMHKWSYFRHVRVGGKILKYNISEKTKKNVYIFFLAPYIYVHKVRQLSSHACCNNVANLLEGFFTMNLYQLYS